MAYMKQVKPRSVQRKALKNNESRSFGPMPFLSGCFHLISDVSCFSSIGAGPGLPLTFKFWKSRLPGCQFWKSRKKKMIHLLLLWILPYSDTVNVWTWSHPLFFVKRHLFNVPYISGTFLMVFLLSVNVRTPKTCPLFLIKLLFFTTGIFCIFALFTFGLV